MGAGVVALGLRRRGRAMIGLDVSAPMLARARSRLGSVIVRSDAVAMSIATDSVAHGVSVWVVHSVHDPVRLFEETARVLGPAGRYVMCAAQRPASDDAVGRIISEMAARVDSALRASESGRPSGQDPVDRQPRDGYRTWTTSVK